MTVKIDMKEARAVGRFTSLAVQQLNEKDDPSLLLSLISAWSLTTRNEDRKVIGKKMLDLLNKSRMRDPLIAREVLHHVGTPVCMCDAKDAWTAVEQFLGEDHLLSVNIAALAAAVRLCDSGQPITEKFRKNCLRSAERLINSRCPDAHELAEAFLARA
jgi:hypothetical protein